MSIDFGRTDQDYARHRQGFPDSFFQRAMEDLVKAPGRRLLDLGTGTGTLARGFSRRGFQVTGLDPSEALLNQARTLAEEEQLPVTWHQASAEQTGLEENGFDVVTAGQCWHWFDGLAAAREIRRLLVPGGLLMIAHFDWLPWQGSLPWHTEQLILKHNPDWAHGGLTGLHTEALHPIHEAGFREVTTCSWEEDIPYSPEAWRGRIRASAGIGASLPEDQVAAFDRDHAALLEEHFPGETVYAPHCVFILTAWAPRG